MNKVILSLVVLAVFGVAFVSATDSCTTHITNCKTGVDFTCWASTDTTTAGGTCCNCTAAEDNYLVSTAAAVGTSKTATGSDSVVSACGKGCKTCTAKNDNTKCSVCITDYSLSGTTCCPTSCGTCTTTTDGTTAPKCESCATGYGVAKGTTVSSTSTVDAADCEECTGKNCETCDATSADTLKVCTSCPDASFMSTDSTTCTACPTNCTSCPNATYCTTCNGSGVTWNNSTQKCFGSALKIGSIVATLVATGVLALVF